jgi:proliferating cell nuclear antigen
MKLTLGDKTKIDMLVALFQLLKNFSGIVKLEINEERLIIQGMDKSHICLFFTEIKSEWFSSFQNSNECQIMLDSSSLFTIFSRIQENQILTIEYEKDSDTIDINVIYGDSDSNVKVSSKKGEYNRYFQLPLIDLEQESYNMPVVDYDAEFSINSKQFYELISQLTLFGDILNIICNESEINLESNGENGKMKVAIVIDDLNEFSISEGENLELSFSLPSIYKMCLTTKLAKDIEVGISNDFPIRFKYDLGENSYATFFIAPKM